MGGQIYFSQDIAQFIVGDIEKRLGLVPPDDGKPYIILDGVAPLTINGVKQELRFEVDTRNWIKKVGP